MTKQEEIEKIREKIREGIAKQIFIWHIGKPDMWGQDIIWEGPPREEYYLAADMVMKQEHSQGVVIKVERELPKLLLSDHYACNIECHRMEQFNLTSKGFVAVESLIKED